MNSLEPPVISHGIGLFRKASISFEIAFVSRYVVSIDDITDKIAIFARLSFEINFFLRCYASVDGALVKMPEKYAMNIHKTLVLSP